jgi:hypothetical protein
MVDFINRLGNAVDSACMGFINWGVKTEKVLVVGGRVFSFIAYHFYSMEGLEKGSKALIANLEMLSLIPSINGLFSETLKTMRGQKDLIYATLIIGSIADCIKKEKDGSLRFALPRQTDGTLDYVKVLYGIGNIFETGGFLQKYRVMTFPRCSQFAQQLGSIKMFENVTFGDVPVLKTLTDKPKDLFVFSASLYVLVQSFRKPVNNNFLSPLNLAKLTGSLGKIILISCSDFMLARKYLVTLTVIDVFTQNASLIGLILKRCQDREKRFVNPTLFD